MSDSDLKQSMEMLGHPEDNYTIEDLSRIRKMIAVRMTRSAQTIPHFPAEALIDFRAALRARKHYINEGLKVSVNDMVMKIAALTLKAMPDVNCGYVEGKRVRYNRINVAAAVAIDEGLMTPVVKDADQKPISVIAEEMIDLAARAQTRRLKPDEYGEATFTVSNLGMFGVSRFGSIINEGQAAILSIGGLQTPLEFGPGGSVIEGAKIAVTLTSDHRLVDGAMSAKWLKAFSEIANEPELIFAT